MLRLIAVLCTQAYTCRANWGHYWWSRIGATSQCRSRKLKKKNKNDVREVIECVAILAVAAASTSHTTAGLSELSSLGHGQRKAKTGLTCTHCTLNSGYAYNVSTAEILNMLIAHEICVAKRKNGMSDKRRVEIWMLFFFFGLRNAQNVRENMKRVVWSITFIRAHFEFQYIFFSSTRQHTSIEVWAAFG